MVHKRGSDAGYSSGAAARKGTLSATPGGDLLLTTRRSRSGSVMVAAGGGGRWEEYLLFCKFTKLTNIKIASNKVQPIVPFSFVKAVRWQGSNKNICWGGMALELAQKFLEESYWELFIMNMWKKENHSAMIFQDHVRGQNPLADPPLARQSSSPTGTARSTKRLSGGKERKL